VKPQPPDGFEPRFPSGKVQCWGYIMICPIFSHAHQYIGVVSCVCIYIYITNNHQLEHLLIPILYSLYCHYRLLEPAQILLYVSLPLYTVCMYNYTYTHPMVRQRQS